MPRAHLPVFVVSVDAARYAAARAELQAHGFSPHHYSGVRGADAEARRLRDVSPFARHCCTDKMLGCALSHQRLARDLTLAWPAAEPAVLVLEDDARVAGATPAALDALVADYAAREPAWEVVRLYCQGRCRPHDRFLSGSTAAYLLSRAGARRLARLRAVYHIDMQLMSPEIVAFNGPRLFTTRDDRAGLLIGDQRLDFWLRQPVLRLPRNVELSFAGYLVATAGLAALAGALLRRRPSTALALCTTWLAMSAAVLERGYGVTRVRRSHWRRALLVTVVAAALAALLLHATAGRGAAVLLLAAPALLGLELLSFAGVVGLASLE